MLEPPAVVAGRYRVLRELGRGGMGQLYVVEHVHTGEQLALKVLAFHGSTSAVAIERFKREARAPVKIKSEHVVRVIDADVAPELDGRPFLVMELLEGSDLEQFAGGTPQPFESVLAWLRQIAVGLDKAHALGIVHRDLKPENLFLTRRDDGSELVKILDFGIAKLVATSKDMTEAGTMLGTPGYMSPEQARGDLDQLGPASDVWALGLIAYRLLSGRHYWTGENAALVIAQIVYERIRPPSEVGLPLGPAFDAWFLRSCERDSGRRFASASEQAEGLAACLPKGTAPLPAAPDDGRAGGGRQVAFDTTVVAATAPPAGSGSIEGVSIVSGPPAEILDRAAVPPAPDAVRDAQPTNEHEADPLAAPAAAPDRESALAPPAPRASVPAQKAYLGVALAAVAVVGALAAALSATRMEPVVAPADPPARASGSTPAADDPRAPFRIRDLPIPRSTVPGASEAYRLGVQTVASDGSGVAAIHFRRAAELDEQMAAARVRLLVYLSAEKKDRALFDQARAHLSTLTRRDQEILEGLEPLYLLDPGDYAEAHRRWERLLERRPNDVELLLASAATSSSLSGFDRVLSAFDRVLSIEPTLPDALGFKLQACAYAGDDSCVREATDACAKRSATSYSCLYYRAEQADERGQCAEMESLGRALVRNNPSVVRGHQVLVLGALGSGRSRSAVAALIERQKSAAVGSDQGAMLAQEAFVAALFGDFDAAERKAKELEPVVAQGREQGPHGMLAYLRAHLALETGAPRRAATIAEEFLDRRDGWSSDPRAEDFALAADPTPVLLRLLGEAGATSDLRSHRDRWLADWTRRLQSVSRSFLWLHAWAGTAYDAATAREALDQRNAFEPIVPFRPKAMTELGEGMMYFHLEQWTSAEERLRRATQICRAGRFPFEHVRAHEWLGRALEKRDKPAEACTAYRVVLDRWGRAKPHSVTAERVRTRVKNLGCTEEPAR
jgi:eukaryotic-like serine/threonine-protein kinase